MQIIALWSLALGVAIIITTIVTMIEMRRSRVRLRRLLQLLQSKEKR